MGKEGKIQRRKSARKSIVYTYCSSASCILIWMTQARTIQLVSVRSLQRDLSDSKTLMDHMCRENVTFVIVLRFESFAVSYHKEQWSQLIDTPQTR